MAAIDVSTMQGLITELERVTLLAELESKKRGQDEARIRAIRAAVVKEVPSDAGGLDDGHKWADLSLEKQDVLHLDVLKATAVLRRIANPGPQDPHIMSGSYPKSATIWWMLVAFSLLTVAVLCRICYLWEDASYSCRSEKKSVEADKQTKENKREEAARLRSDGEKVVHDFKESKNQAAAEQQQADRIRQGSVDVKHYVDRQCDRGNRFGATKEPSE